MAAAVFVAARDLLSCASNFGSFLYKLHKKFRYLVPDSALLALHVGSFSANLIVIKTLEASEVCSSGPKYLNEPPARS